MTHTDTNPADALAAIIAAGVARFEATLPEYARRQSVETEPPEIRTHLAVSADRQRELCLNCPLPDCVGVNHLACPIRIESRRVWRERR
jgi:hypothetical protein